MPTIELENCGYLWRRPNGQTNPPESKSHATAKWATSAARVVDRILPWQDEPRVTHVRRAIRGRWKFKLPDILDDTQIPGPRANEKAMI